MKKKVNQVDSHREPSGFALGFLMGAGLVFLFGTKEGRRVKAQLAKKGQQVIDDLPEFVDRVQKEGEKLSVKAKKVKKDLDQKVQEINAQKKPISGTRSRKRYFTRQGKKIA